MKSIANKPIKACTVIIPGSKSFTHRFFIASALASGDSEIKSPLMSEDTRLTLSALKALGTDITITDGAVRLKGQNGRFSAHANPIVLNNSGTSMRLIAGLVVLGEGTYTLTGDERMKERPIKDLLESLNALGIKAMASFNNGCPPIEITAGPVKNRHVSVDCSKSSQYLSSLLLLAPLSEHGLEISVKSNLVSKPYVGMTLSVMEKFGIKYHSKDEFSYAINGGQKYISGNHRVEPDASNAGYFWAAGAITGQKIEVKGITEKSIQGDVGFTKVLESMGCDVIYSDDSIAVKGNALVSGTFDMGSMPDLVPTLAIVAAFAKGTTRITNVAHLKIKETDRLSAVYNELSKMGCQIEMTDDSLFVTGSDLKGADIETYNDHRIAMSFGIAGLKVPGVRIQNERCVEKSFPNFWEVLDCLYQ